VRAVEEPEPVAIRDRTIRLGQFLQLAGAVDSGAEAKALVAAGQVSVDGATETRRGAQLEVGALVVADGRSLVVVAVGGS